MKKISEHFSLSEFTYSRMAVENGLSNEPPPAVVKALQALCVNLLEPLRARCGNQPMHVLSGYRGPELNRLVRGVPRSQHQRGEAADIYVSDIGQLIAVLRSPDAPVFDQAIFYSRKNFVHLSYKTNGKNRRQFLVV